MRACSLFELSAAATTSSTLHKFQILPGKKEPELKTEKLGDVKDPGKNQKQMTAAHKRTSIANTAANVMEIEGLPLLFFWNPASCTLASCQVRRR